MLNLAIAVDGRFEHSDYELKKTTPGFTLETVRHFRSRYGKDAQIYWLIGADTVDELPGWYKITDLIDECNLCAMHRAGCEAPDFTKFVPLWGLGRVQKLQRNIIPTPLVDISSTEIRKRLASGGDVTNMLAPSVADYIRRHSLYK
jgi:nicotinate-nucleotide adenylyltransferase